MKNTHEKIAEIDWQRVTGELNQKGYAIVSQFLPNQSCEELIRKYDDSDLYRKTITMERHSFGLGGDQYLNPARRIKKIIYFSDIFPNCLLSAILDRSVHLICICHQNLSSLIFN